MLKRKVPKINFDSKTIDELFLILNDKFLESKGNRSERSWIVSPTVWEEESKRFVVGDSHEEEELEEDEEYLPPYYGHTMREAIINAIIGEKL